MSNLNLSNASSWVTLGSITINNPNYLRLPSSRFPILGTKNCYKITATTVDTLPIERNWVTAGYVRLAVASPSLVGEAVIRSQRLLLQTSNILYTPFRASEYSLELSISSYINNIVYFVEETTQYIEVSPLENLMLNEFEAVNIKLNQLLQNTSNP